MEGDLIELLKKRVGFHTLRPERYYLEEAWLINMAFWYGKHDFTYQGGVWRDLKTDLGPDDPAYQVNLIRPRVLNAAALLLNVNATYRAVPETGSSRDRELAALSDRLFEHIRSSSDFRWTLTMSTLWKTICGTSYIKTYWDPLLGEPDRFYKTDGRTSAVIPEVMLSPRERAEKDALGHFEDLPPGDISTSVLSPFAGYKDSSSRDGGMRDARWFAEKHFVDIEVIAERWEMDEKDIQPMEAEQGLRNYEEAIAFFSKGTGLLPSWYMTPEDKRGKRTMYIEMWERPSREHKHGRRIAFAGGRILNQGRMGGLDNPYAADRTGWAHIPYVQDDLMPGPGRQWGEGLVSDAICPQVYLNYMRSQSARFGQNFGLPDTFVDELTNLDPEEMKAGGGGIYKIPAGGKVQHGPIPQMPPDIARFAADAENDLNKVMSQSVIQADKLPGQIRSGTAIRAINEERYMPLSIPSSCTVRTVRDVGRQCLALAKLFYGDRRTLRYLGEDNEWIVEAFNAANLVTDLRIVGEPSITDTTNSERDEMLDAIQSNAFNPQLDPETRSLILKGLHYNTSDEFIKRKLQAERSQERELREIMADPAKYAQGGYPVMEWEDHEREAAVCVAFMYTPEFDKLDPMTKGIITKHWKDHSAYIQMAQERQMQMQAMMKGTPGQKGAASQPSR